MVSGWGPGSKRKKLSAANWQKPFSWNEKARTSRTRTKVFCSSMADVFDEEVPDQWRRELFNLIVLTPHLDWQILTKRPHLAEAQLRRIGYWDMLPIVNVWIGATMENQKCFDQRWPYLKKIPATVRFCSYEPALGPLSLPKDVEGKLHWLIAGGETTLRRNGSRPSDPEWFRSVRDQCTEHQVAFFFKQWGNDLLMEDGSRRWHGKSSSLYKSQHSILEGRLHQSFPTICN